MDMCPTKKNSKIYFVVYMTHIHVHIDPQVQKCIDGLSLIQKWVYSLLAIIGKQVQMGSECKSLNGFL